MPKKEIINILGAGPSGLAAAIGLARAGREVHVYERYETVGKRFQGDLQGLENWSLKQNVLEQIQSFGIAINFEATPFHEITFTDGRHTFQSHSEKPYFYLVKRGPFPTSLDTGLCQQALEHGVKIHYRSTLSPDKVDIIATGPKRKSVVAADKGLVFETDLPNMAIAIYQDEAAFQGYSYLLVSQGYGCLCTVVYNELQRLNTCFERTIEVARRFAPLNLENARSVGGIGSFSFGHSVTMGKALLVGESAGFQDLLWGFGIRMALTSGHLAGRSLLTTEDYSANVQQAINPLLKASVVNRFLWEKGKHNANPYMPRLLSWPAPFNFTFQDLCQFSVPHRLLYPFALRYVKKYYPQCFNSSSLTNSLTKH
jgi:flavin-dependent dehydrogenase